MAAASAAIDDWVLLAYRLPREPSGPRVTVWRKLRRLGAVQLVDGLVALPANSQNREQFDWLADEILEAGGDAWTFDARPGSKSQRRALSARFNSGAADDFESLHDEASALLESSDRPHRRTVQRLQRELDGIEARSPAPARSRTRARSAVAKLAARLDAEGDAR